MSTGPDDIDPETFWDHLRYVDDPDMDMDPPRPEDT